MDFYSFFLSYKKCISELHENVSFRKFPFYKQFSVALLVLLLILSLFLILVLQCDLDKVALLTAIATISILCVADIYEKKKYGGDYLLENQYKPIAEKRIQAVIELLRIHHIEPSDSEKIDGLISLTLSEQQKSDRLSHIEKTLKKLTFLSSILGFIVIHIADALTPDDKLYVAIYLLGILATLFLFYYFLLRSQLRFILCPDYNVYTELIDDLQDIKVFHESFKPEIRKSSKIIPFRRK